MGRKVSFCGGILEKFFYMDEKASSTACRYSVSRDYIPSIPNIETAVRNVLIHTNESRSAFSALFIFIFTDYLTSGDDFLKLYLIS